MEEEDEYACIKKKPLKLKSKLTKGETRTVTAPIPADIPIELAIPDSSKLIVPTTTKAEEAFRVRQEKTAEKRINQKALKTHKQRVEEFNKHLDSLSEHYDVPKVSWTK